MAISLDTETTGLDLNHGAKPYLVTIANDKGEQAYWEWDVDPYTRDVVVDPSDLRDIEQYVMDADIVVLQNAKFDVAALRTVAPKLAARWPWAKTHDTLYSAHLLGSNQPKDLTSQAIRYLGVNIQPYEDAMRQEVMAARNEGKRRGYHIAAKGLPEMPSAKDTVWKYDCWLPRYLAFVDGLDDDHPWWRVTADYANVDSLTTMALHQQHQQEIEERGLTAIYFERLKLLPIVYTMERNGITLSKRRLREITKTYRDESTKAKTRCVALAASYGYDLVLPKSGVNNSLRNFMMGDGGLALPVVAASKKTGEASLNAAVLEQYVSDYPERSKERVFVVSLMASRKRDTALAYMDGYQRFWRDFAADNPDYARLYCSVNPVGTDTLRWSSQNPNEQNISKKEDFNLRYCFGPADGREWWSIDAENIELRIPAYKAPNGGEAEMIALFEQPNEPPHFGSYHDLVCSVLHPEKYAACLRDGVSFKDRYKATWYQWTKNGNFAVQYGAVAESGTADRAYHVPGGQAKVQSRFSRISQLNKQCIAFAQKHGFVETVPDKTVDPKRGYPLLCSRSERGYVKPTIPLNYVVQGTAMWWTSMASIRCFDYLQRRNRKLPPSQHAYLIMNVHDELVFDFPKRYNPNAKQPSKRYGNWRDIKAIADLMRYGGECIGVPTPVGIEYHPVSWDKGERVKL